MKLLKRETLFFVVTGLTLLFGAGLPPSYAGGISGGGGTGIYCKMGVPKPYLMLDTYEGSIRRQYTYDQMKGLTSDQILEKVLFKLQAYKYHFNALKLLLEKVDNSLSILPEDVAISIPSDAQDGDTPLIYPRDCELLGIGFFEASGQLVMDGRAFKGMDELEKAAFYLHEGVFYSKRQWQSVYFNEVVLNTAKLAAGTREVVAFLLADQSNPQNVTAAGLNFAGFLGHAYDPSSTAEFPLDRENMRLHMNAGENSVVRVQLDLYFNFIDQKQVLPPHVCSGSSNLSCTQTSQNSIRMNLSFAERPEDVANNRHILTGPRSLSFTALPQPLPPDDGNSGHSVTHYVSLNGTAYVSYLLDEKVVYQKKIEYTQAQYFPQEKRVEYILELPSVIPNYVDPQLSP